MSKSLIQTVNPNVQTVADDGAVSPGTVVRRFGCNCRLSGNAHELVGNGYYALDGMITAVAAAATPVTVTLYADGVAIPGMTASVTPGAAGDVVTLPLINTVRVCGNCATTVTCVITGATSVTNYAMRIVKL